MLRIRIHSSSLMRIELETQNSPALSDFYQNRQLPIR